MDLKRKKDLKERQKMNSSSKVSGSNGAALFVFVLFSVKFLCPPARPHRCRNNRICLQPEQMCNGIDDCGDNSDEDHCGGKSI